MIITMLSIIAIIIIAITTDIAIIIDITSSCSIIIIIEQTNQGPVSWRPTTVK